MAAKWFVRRIADGVARRVPTAEEVEQVQRDIAGCTVDVSIIAGDRLSELHDPGQLQLCARDHLPWSRRRGRSDPEVRARLAELPFEFEEPRMRIVDRQRFPHRIKEDAQLRIPLAGRNLSCRTHLATGDIRHATGPRHPRVHPHQNDLTASGTRSTIPYLAGHGYAGVRVDLRGSGNSEGVLTDEYLEQFDAEQVLAWLAAQPWCNGRTGMMGISWGGFNTLQVAARRPPSLRAIVTACSTDDRYADDVHYMGGCLLTDNLSWASTMFAYNSCPPDPEVVGERWREMWQQRLHGSGLWLAEWLRHQRRDAYWRHGSICENYSDITCPVLAVSGWADGHQLGVPLLAELDVPRKG